MTEKELLEKTAEIFYDIGQQQAQKMGMEFSRDRYSEIAPDAKEFYRAFARHVINKTGMLLEVIAFYANPDNWATPIDKDGEQLIIKDGPVHDDQGELARKALLEVHGRNINSDDNNG